MQNALLKANQEAGKHLLAPHSLQINHKAIFLIWSPTWICAFRSCCAALMPAFCRRRFFGGGGYERHPCTGATLLAGGPIDGTKNFVHNLMQSCLATALCKDGEALLACVYNPWNGEFYFAQQGKGATLNGEPIQVSNRSFQDSMVATGQGYGARKETVKRLGPLWEHCYIHCRGIRAFGSAELTLCYVAAGRLDGYLEQALMPWDYIPGNLIIREAGGVATNWKGELPSPTGMDSLLVGTQAFHQVMLPLCQDL
jgi:hypothetical protein